MPLTQNVHLMDNKSQGHDSPLRNGDLVYLSTNCARELLRYALEDSDDEGMDEAKLIRRVASDLSMERPHTNSLKDISSQLSSWAVMEALLKSDIVDMVVELICTWNFRGVKNSQIPPMLLFLQTVLNDLLPYAEISEECGKLSRKVWGNRNFVTELLYFVDLSDEHVVCAALKLLLSFLNRSPATFRHDGLFILAQKVFPIVCRISEESARNGYEELTLYAIRVVSLLSCSRLIYSDRMILTGPLFEAVTGGGGKEKLCGHLFKAVKYCSTFKDLKFAKEVYVLGVECIGNLCTAHTQTVAKGTLAAEGQSSRLLHHLLDVLYLALPKSEDASYGYNCNLSKSEALEMEPSDNVAPLVETRSHSTTSSGKDYFYKIHDSNSSVSNTSRGTDQHTKYQAPSSRSLSSVSSVSSSVPGSHGSKQNQWLKKVACLPPTNRYAQNMDMYTQGSQVSPHSKNNNHQSHVGNNNTNTTNVGNHLTYAANKGSMNTHYYYPNAAPSQQNDECPSGYSSYSSGKNTPRQGRRHNMKGSGFGSGSGSGSADTKNDSITTVGTSSSSTRMLTSGNTRMPRRSSNALLHRLSEHDCAEMLYLTASLLVEYLRNADLIPVASDVRPQMNKPDKMDKPKPMLEKIIDGKHWDFIIRAQDEEVRVQKCILAAYVPYFSSLFEHEPESEGTEFPESIDIVRIWVRYMYTFDDSLISSMDIASCLLRIADRLCQDILLRDCEIYLYNCLDRHTLHFLFGLAAQCNATSLLAACATFALRLLPERLSRNTMGIWWLRGQSMLTSHGPQNPIVEIPYLPLILDHVHHLVQNFFKKESDEKVESNKEKKKKERI